MMVRCLFLLAVLLVLFCQTSRADEISSLPAIPLVKEPSPQEFKEQEVFNLGALQASDGKIIHEIHIHGLRWTKEQAVRWLLSQHEGDVFNAEHWLVGIHKLYDTTIVYNILTAIHPVQDGKIDIELIMTDRWTLLPYGIAQAGGGANQFGVGIEEVNFLGYFGQLSASYSEFDNLPAYDLNYYQEFFRDTNLILGFDLSQTQTPVDLQANNRNDLGSFSWQRNQEQILIGKKFDGPLRFFTYIEYFKDKMITNQGAPEVSVYSAGQYRLRPTWIFGRSELTNFLEEGYELTLAPTSANFFDSDLQYSQAVATFKKVYLHGNTNYAYFINVGAMTDAPIPYLFHLGGFDTVRGFSEMRTVGRCYVNNNLEYRPYLTRFRLPLIDEIVLQGNLFQDFGIMWDSSDLSASQKVNSNFTMLSEGFGIRLNFMQFAGAIVRVDLARAVIPDEGWGLSLGVGQFF